MTTLRKVWTTTNRAILANRGGLLVFRVAEDGQRAVIEARELATGCLAMSAPA